MAKTPKKKPKVRADFAQNAFRVVQEATGAVPKTSEPAPKNVAAAELGRKGGLARNKAMNKKKRSESAKKAARARWGDQ
jgi:hypothetical protein